MLVGCKKDNGMTGPDIKIPDAPLTMKTELGKGTWDGPFYVIPVLIKNNVIDLRAMSIKVTVSPIVSDANFNVLAGSALSNVGSSLMMMSTALPQYVQCDWAVGTEKGWEGTGEIIKLRFTSQVTPSSFIWKAYDSDGKLFHS